LTAATYGAKSPNRSPVSAIRVSLKRLIGEGAFILTPAGMAGVFSGSVSAAIGGFSAGVSAAVHINTMLVGIDKHDDRLRTLEDIARGRDDRGQRGEQGAGFERLDHRRQPPPSGSAWGEKSTPFSSLT
jgi:hypothetical protein